MTDGTTAKRVVIQHPVRPVDDFGLGDWSGHRAVDQSVRRWLIEEERERTRPTRPIVRLTDGGIDWGTAPRRGDEIGYGMRPFAYDDCLAAALATCTQVPIEQIPSLKLSQRLAAGEDSEEISQTSWERIERWAASQGLELRFWQRLPAPRRRWIGVVDEEPDETYVVDEEGRLVRSDEVEPAFNGHAFVMSHERLLFDPSCSVKPPPGMERVGYHPSQITYGISFDQQQKEE